jgi:hypothetical protein
MSRDPYQVKPKCSIPKPSTVADCEIGLKRLHLQMANYKSRADGISSLMSSYQNEIDRIQKLMDSAHTQFTQLQKQNRQDEFDLKCLEKWKDELNKKDLETAYQSECKDYIVKHIRRCNSKSVQENYMMSEKYPHQNYFLPPDSFKFLKITTILPIPNVTPIVTMTPEMREKRKKMTSIEKKEDKKMMADAWRNAYAMMLAQNIFDNLTTTEIKNLAHYLRACELLDKPMDQKCDWVRFSTYADVLAKADYEYDHIILSDIYDCNGKDYDEGHCCHKRYAYYMEEFKYITLKTNDIVSCGRL